MEILFNVTFKNNKPLEVRFEVEMSVPKAILATIYWTDEKGQHLKNIYLLKVYL